MDSHHLRPLLGRTECHTSTCLQYCITAPVRSNGKFVLEAMVKVPEGVRFLCELRSERPHVTELMRHCLDNGQFSARPYLLGQATDDSTADCVMALYEDCCRRHGLDATELLVRTYPGWETTEAWSADAWKRVRELAEWQETTFPVEWTTDCLIGLLMSLNGQHRTQLARTLEIAISSSVAALALIDGL
jgi:hypothetical protein